MTMEHPCRRRWIFRWLGLKHSWVGTPTCAFCDEPTPQCGTVGGVAWGFACTKRKGHAYGHRAVTSTTRTNGRITGQSTTRWGGERDPDDNEGDYFEEGETT